MNINLSSEIMTAIAEIQKDEIFDDDFIDVIDTIIYGYLLDNEAEMDDDKGLRQRVLLARSLRYYRDKILEVFPQKQKS